MWRPHTHVKHASVYFCMMAVEVWNMNMYSEFVSIFALIVVGTAGFTSYVTQKWVIPFSLLTVTIILAVLALKKHMTRLAVTVKNDDTPPEVFDALPAGCIWIVWMTYGVLFLDVTPILEGLVAYVHGTVVVILVFVSHSRADVRRNSLWASSLLVVVAGLLFLPHPDAINRLMTPTVLYIKIVLFYGLFICTEVAQKLEFESRTRARNPPTELERIYAVMIQIVQTAWVLLSISPLFLIAVIQIAILCYEIRTYLLEKTMAETSLPVTTADHRRTTAGAPASRRRAPKAQPKPKPKPNPTAKASPKARRSAAPLITLPSSRPARASAPVSGSSSALSSAASALFANPSE